MRHQEESWKFMKIVWKIMKGIKMQLGQYKSITNNNKQENQQTSKNKYLETMCSHLIFDHIDMNSRTTADLPAHFPLISLEWTINMIKIKMNIYIHNHIHNIIY